MTLAAILDFREYLRGTKHTWFDHDVRGVVREETYGALLAIDWVCIKL